MLAHSVGKSVRVAVFASGAKAQEALAAGATIVGAEECAFPFPDFFFLF